ncbi:putative RING-H2 finger protein ATL21B [Impatiens glandulifera]|uniref:putative RING-H2 finger protein ATL21B n=1 Tax=Impatiens glandulifera TaxID=253017 RepID=UPI001FB127C1|nr:putative RING-H2 finger protein ATL21B [Impatiens glandulifera]
MAARAVLLSLFFFLIQGQGGIETTSSNDYDDDQCKPETCGEDVNFDVRFPFRLKGRHLKHCGYPGFDLSCSPRNQTILNLPLYSSSSSDVVIDYIDYKDQLIYASVPDCCFVKIIENLNLSASIFQPQPQPLTRDFSYQNYLMSCPKAMSYSSYESFLNNCTSDSTQQVYHAISSDTIFYKMPLWPCKFINAQLWNLGILTLSWSKPMCGDCETEEGLCRIRKNNNTNNREGLETECYLGEEPLPTHRLVRFYAEQNRNSNYNQGFNSIKNIIIRGNFTIIIMTILLTPFSQL